MASRFHKLLNKVVIFVLFLLQGQGCKSLSAGGLYSCQYMRYMIVFVFDHVEQNRNENRFL